jgi:hypothetical protein
VRQLILSPRWIFWHVLTLGAVVTCGLLAAWQWGRAGSAFGSAINVGYGLQWPVFALFFAYMWWRMLRMEAAKLAEEAEEAAGPQVGVDHGAAADVPAGSSTAGAAEPGPVAGERPAPEPEPAGPSPFGPRPASVAVPRVTAEDDPELAAYNRMLAALAARDTAG